MLAGLSLARKATAKAPEAVISNGSIRDAADYSAAMRGKSLLIIQRGKVLFEEYPNGFCSNEAHKIYSGTKAFWCLAALAAQEDGLLRLNERASATITEWQGDRKKSRITIMQLLDFSSGLDPFFELHEDGIKDRDVLAVQRHLAADPGDAFIYGPCSLQVFHEILKRRLAPRRLKPTDYLERRVLRPMRLGPQRYVMDGSGNPLLAAGFILSARQWSQIGKAVLNESGHIAPPEMISDIWNSGSKVNHSFGLGFWNNGSARRSGACEVDVETMLEEKWPRQHWRNACLSRSAPPDLLASIGSGAQRMYVVPSLDMIVVRQGKNSAFKDAEFLRRLFRAV